MQISFFYPTLFSRTLKGLITVVIKYCLWKVALNGWMISFEFSVEMYFFSRLCVC